MTIDYSKLSSDFFKENEDYLLSLNVNEQVSELAKNIKDFSA